MPTEIANGSVVAVIESIEEKIFVIRGQRAMLDSDLAEVYGVSTKKFERAGSTQRRSIP